MSGARSTVVPSLLFTVSNPADARIVFREQCMTRQLTVVV